MTTIGTASRNTKLPAKSDQENANAARRFRRHSCRRALRDRRAVGRAAQEWPTRPITLVVPFSPGGGVDISARLQAQAIGDILGQSVVVENIGGGAGMTAGVRVAHAAPDGYTFMIGNAGTHAFTQTLYKKPLYNSVTDFTPVGLVSESPRIVNVRKDLPVKNLQEFITWLKANEKTASSARPASAPALICPACCSISRSG